MRQIERTCPNVQIVSLSGDTPITQSSSPLAVRNYDRSAQPRERMSTCLENIVNWPKRQRHRLGLASIRIRCHTTEVRGDVASGSHLRSRNETLAACSGRHRSRCPYLECNSNV